MICQLCSDVTAAYPLCGDCRNVIDRLTATAEAVGDRGHFGMLQNPSALHTTADGALLAEQLIGGCEVWGMKGRRERHDEASILVERDLRNTIQTLLNLLYLVERGHHFSAEYSRTRDSGTLKCSISLSVRA